MTSTRRFIALLTIAGMAGPFFTGSATAQSAKKPPVSKKSSQAKGKAKVDENTEKSDEASDSNDQSKAVKKQLTTEKAVFGGGCFWCVEAVYEKIPGVVSAVSGYAGGFVPRPNYEAVSTGETGHAEVVQIEYDPKLVTYDQLLEVFFACHDPTTPNQQGPDFGTQYRSIILTSGNLQRKSAIEAIQKLNNSNYFGASIVTQVAPLAKFYPAEKYHQDYYKKHPNLPYCQIQIAPKLKKLGLK